MTGRHYRPRRRPCDVVPDAERAALKAAAQAAEKRGTLLVSTRTGRPAPRLLIHDPGLATWLINDGRARRAGRHRAHLLLTLAHLPGLSAVDIHDAVVLDAYLTAFAHTIADAGYDSRIETL